MPRDASCALQCRPPAAQSRPNRRLEPATFGLCNNPNFHGHNYELDISVEGEIDPDTGYVLDLNRLKQLAEERVLRHLDHKNLNLDVAWFASLNPTSENIAVVFWRELRRAVPDDWPCSIRLWETPRNYVDYAGA